MAIDPDRACVEACDLAGAYQLVHVLVGSLDGVRVVHFSVFDDMFRMLFYHFTYIKVIGNCRWTRLVSV